MCVYSFCDMICNENENVDHDDDDVVVVEMFERV